MLKDSCRTARYAHTDSLSYKVEQLMTYWEAIIVFKLIQNTYEKD
jgi:hypothetical protein